MNVFFSFYTLFGYNSYAQNGTLVNTELSKKKKKKKMMSVTLIGGVCCSNCSAP